MQLCGLIFVFDNNNGNNLFEFSYTASDKKNNIFLFDSEMRLSLQITVNLEVMAIKRYSTVPSKFLGMGSYPSA